MLPAAFEAASLRYRRNLSFQQGSGECRVTTPNRTVQKLRCSRIFAEMCRTHHENRLIDYAGVSTGERPLYAQLWQLRAAGCGKIYRDKVTGARAERIEFNHNLDWLALGRS